MFHALNTEELELIIAHGAQLRDTAFVYACRRTCTRLREATAPWVLFYAEERPVEWGRLFTGPKQLRVHAGELSRWAVRGAFAGSLEGLDLSVSECSTFLGVQGAREVARLLPSMGSLAELNLAYNDMGGEGVAALAPAIAASGSLAMLE